MSSKPFRFFSNPSFFSAAKWSVVYLATEDRLDLSAKCLNFSISAV